MFVDTASGASKMPVSFVNISAYKFTPIDNLAERRRSLLQLCKRLGLKGTILISSEGINMFLAGSREAIDEFLEIVTQDKRFEDLPVKESFSDYQPFSRMLVRIKKEIISMGVDEIQPACQTSPKISATELKQWLDAGKDVTLLDVRNDYEVEIGTFENAQPIGIDSFRQFPEKIKSLPAEMKQQPIVMFCTGGIRCEKAGPMMERAGFEQVYQLDGGILKYFEDCGGDHYAGECFVFDKRVALDPNLQETATTQCYACQAVVTAAAQQSSQYVPGKSCPSCYQPPAAAMAQLIERRNAAIAAIANPLPGCTPYDNIRPLNVPLRFDRRTASEFLGELHSHLGTDYWQQEFELGRILYKQQAISPEQEVRAGWRIEHLLPQSVEPAVNADIRLVYEDESLLVVNKPAPLPMHACGRFNRNSLIYILSQIYPGERLRMSHRLDANTTGLVILCRKRIAADAIRNQFEAGKIHKTYLAKVVGYPEQDEFVCDASIAVGPAQAGVRLTDENGRNAATEFRVVERLPDGNSIIECHPKTGRTNQIRVHLWHLGLPIVGDPSYLSGGELEESQTLSIDSPPMCLHAWKLEFQHPVSGERVQFSAAPTSFSLGTA
jgi:RluA family pseudouridine synthase